MSADPLMIVVPPAGSRPGAVHVCGCPVPRKSKNVPEEVLERVLLQVLLGEVLQVALGEGDLRGEDELVACMISIDFHAGIWVLPRRSRPSLNDILLRGGKRPPGLYDTSGRATSSPRVSDSSRPTAVVLYPVPPDHHLSLDLSLSTSLCPVALNTL